MPGLNLTQKIISTHLDGGKIDPGTEISLRIDQGLLQDTTGTMGFLQLEELGVDRIKIPFAIVYVDHNILAIDFKNPDDHMFLRSFAQKHGIHFSRPGTGICHYLHMERFAKPGQTLLGADSHTVMAGSVSMIAIGAGGLDVAVALAGHPFVLAMPKVVEVRLENALGPWVQAKDIILELLRRRDVKGGVGRIFEFTGPGVETLSVPQRGTICNMIAELGAQYVKTYYVEDGFETVTSSCPVPIVMAGGKKLPELDALTMAYNAVQQGAAGVDMGRNIFQSDAPKAMLAAVNAVVHKNTQPKDAFDLFNSLKAKG